MKKTILFIVTLCLSTTLFANANVNNADNESSKKTEAPTSYLFVQSSSKAKIEAHKKEANTYTITLQNVSPYVTYFSERPKRVANTMPIAQFLKMWDGKSSNNFKEDPPNADFNGIQVGLLSPDKPLNIALEISQPVYDSKAQTLTYTAKTLAGDTSAIPTSGTLSHVVLFIDNACLSCFGP